MYKGSDHCRKNGITCISGLCIFFQISPPSYPACIIKENTLLFKLKPTITFYQHIIYKKVKILRRGMILFPFRKLIKIIHLNNLFYTFVMNLKHSNTRLRLARYIVY